jgi:hypothetical protein
MMDNEELVLRQMQSLIDAWEEKGDRRAIFLSCYVMMTRNMLAAIDSGSFEDNAWVSTLLHCFATYYFNALQAYETEQAGAPGVWQLAFNAARQPHTYVVQNLVLGVNAHINYDLVFALADVLAPEWEDLSEEQRGARYRDHCHVNDIIYQTIDSVQDQVVDRYSPALELVDELMGPLDEWLTSKLISDWREEVWENATRLVQSLNEAERETLRKEVEHRSLNRAHAILGQEGLAGLVDLV